MAPRTQLEVTTSSVLRLVKEEASYHREMEQQTERIEKLESGQGGDDENQEYLLKQEVHILIISPGPISLSSAFTRSDHWLTSPASRSGRD